MAQFTHLLFDLDGTLVNSKKGIIASLQYALKKLNYPIPPSKDLEIYIGPSMNFIFGELLQTTDTALIKKAIAHTRQRYAEKGIYESEVYPHVKETLQILKTKGCSLFVATSKAQFFAEKVLIHHQLIEFFDGIYGSTLDGERTDKTELIDYLIQREALLPEQALMVGDRKHDILGAQENNVTGVGALYGYGNKTELENVGAQHLISCFSELPDFYISNDLRPQQTIDEEDQ